MTLSSSERTTPTRKRERAQADRDAMLAFLREGMVAHLGFTAPSASGGHPVVLPTVYAVDPEGPDEDGTIYVHASVAAGWIGSVVGHDVCVTVTSVDGLVLARCANNHSMNYRSAVVIGRARLVEDEQERLHALALTVDQIVPGRAATLRDHTRKELAATTVVAVPLAEASYKIRAGEASDSPEDVAAGAWAGVLPLRLTTTGAVGNSDSHDDVPPEVRRRARELGA